MSDVLFFTKQLYTQEELSYITLKHHEYKATVSIAFSYSSVLEFGLNLVSVKIGYTILGLFYPVHIYTILLWTMLGLLHTMDAHSGYDWPWSLSILLPFSSGGYYHAFHHSKNVGNFGGASYILELVLGTNKVYF